MALILIVDDDARTADYIGNCLSSAGHRYEVEPSGVLALDRLKRGAFDLLILDVILPGTSGFEICRQVRKDAVLYTLPVLMISAMNNEEEIMHGIAQGADDYIAKPFEVSNMMQRIEALLRATVDAKEIDPLTDLPSGEQTKRELQRRTIANEPFALAYIELIGIREFAYRSGPESRFRAIRHLGRALTHCGKAIKEEEFFVGHMGGGHFVCILPPGHAEKYCLTVRDAWSSHLSFFYEAVGQKRAYEDYRLTKKPGGSFVLLDVLCCITFHDPRVPSTHHAIFETVSQIRLSAQAANRIGVYMDRRG